MPDVRRKYAVVFPLGLDELVGMHLRGCPSGRNKGLARKRLQMGLFIVLKGDPWRDSRRAVFFDAIHIHAPGVRIPRKVGWGEVGIERGELFDTASSATHPAKPSGTVLRQHLAAAAFDAFLASRSLSRRPSSTCLVVSRR